MKRKLGILLTILLTVTACVRNAPDEIPSNDGDGADTPTSLFSQVVNTDTPEVEPTSEDSLDNETSTEESNDTGDGADNVAPSETPFLFTSTPSELITPTVIFTETPFATLAIGATRTPTQVPSPAVPPLDPELEFKGSKRFIETFDTEDNWITGAGSPPDTENIFMFVDGGIMQVTGKIQTYHTWWYSNKRIGNGYVEMDVNTGKCETDDAYGFIVRGALSGESARGYIIGFTCDGKFFVNRLDSDQAYPTFVIYIPTPGDTLNRGTNQINTVGVKMDKETISIYANGYLVGQFFDAAHEYGRYGLFVSAGPTANYTYEVSEIRIWDWTLTED